MKNTSCWSCNLFINGEWTEVKGLVNNLDFIPMIKMTE